jgi:hypothetical protein
MNIKEWRGLRAKRPVFVLLTPQETGEGEKIGAAALGGAWPATLGRGGGREEGENRPGGAGIRFPSPISEEGLAMAAPWQPAAVCGRRARRRRCGDPMAAGARGKRRGERHEPHPHLSSGWGAARGGAPRWPAPSARRLWRAVALGG